MTKHYIPVGTALGSGIIGFFLRFWMLDAGFSADSGLPIANAPSTLALIGFSVVMAVVFVLLSRHGKLSFPGGYDQAFNGTGSTLYMTVMVAAAFLLGASGAITLYTSFSQGLESLITPILGLLNLVSAGCFFQIAVNNYRNQGKGKYSVALLMPAYTCCLWLIQAYQSHSTDPIVLDFVFYFLAIIATVLATYTMAGFAFEKAKVFRTSLFALLGIYFTLVSLADAPGLTTLLQQVAFLLYLASSLLLLHHNVALQAQHTTNQKEEPSNG